MQGVAIALFVLFVPIMRLKGMAWFESILFSCFVVGALVGGGGAFIRP